MDSTFVFRLIGAALIILGIVLASNPEFVSNKPVPDDTFRAVERRIWWGLLIGLCILLQFHQQLLPWQPTVSATLSSLLVGLLIARLLGIALDGSTAKQWLNVGIEIIILAPLVCWYLKAHTYQELNVKNHAPRTLILTARPSLLLLPADKAALRKG